MKANRKTTTFFIAIISVLIMNVSSGHSYETNFIKNKSDIHRSEIRSDLRQEETKYQYVGAEKCSTVCHNNEKMGFQYDNWKTSAHANGFKSLVSKRAKIYAKRAHINGDLQESSACLICHITGSDLDSTYLTSTYKKEDGVTCEACHKHKSDGKTYLPNEADCLKCHNDSLHKMHKFSFKEGSAKIAHARLICLNMYPE